MYVLTYLVQGLGNKIFHFATSIYFYVELRKKNKAFTKLYIAEAKSKHQIDTSKEAFDTLFPNIEKYDWIEFISFKEFDEMKKDCIIIDQNTMKDIPFNAKKNIMFNTNYNFSNVPFEAYGGMIKDMLSFDPILEYDYDFDNDIFLHMRYGDKFEYIARNRILFVVLKPDYYFEALMLLKSKRVRNVYIFTDSKELIENIYMPDFIKMKEFNFVISNEPYWNVFYLAQKFKNLITSESSLIYSGILLNKNYNNVIAFPYTIIPKEFLKKEVSDWPHKTPRKDIYYKGLILRKQRILKPDFTLLDNKNYILRKSL